jgi:hypothetical protein
MGPDDEPNMVTLQVGSHGRRLSPKPTSWIRSIAPSLPLAAS